MNFAKKIAKKLVEINEAIRIDTGSYEVSHAKSPKGTGLWMFGLDFYPKHPKDYDDPRIVGFNGKYGDAIKHVRHLATQKGHRIIYVLP